MQKKNSRKFGGNSERTLQAFDAVVKSLMEMPTEEFQRLLENHEKSDIGHILEESGMMDVIVDEIKEKLDGQVSTQAYYEKRWEADYFDDAYKKDRSPDHFHPPKINSDLRLCGGDSHDCSE